MQSDQETSLLSDVMALKARPEPQVRETIATKVAVYFNNGIFDQSESEIACDIIRLLAKDVELRVRLTIAETLKKSPKIPNDVAVKLAHDVLEVALPILEFSTVLTDEDLLEIIRSTNETARLIAISKRENLSHLISGELINTKHEDVVVSVFNNDTAKISQGSLEFAFNEFKNNGQVVAALINRGDLSVSVVEKILNAVSAQIRHELITAHKIDPKKAALLINASQEKVTLGLLDDVASTPEATKTYTQIPPIPVAVKQPIAVQDNTQANNARAIQTENLVNHLLKEGRLTESLILRSLCEGNLLFFELSMARRAGIPLINARTLMQDGNNGALRSLWKRAKMPESAFDAMNIIINFAVNNLRDSHKNASYSHQLLEHIHEKGFDTSTPLMPYMMALIAGGVQIQDVV